MEHAKFPRRNQLNILWVSWVVMVLLIISPGVACVLSNVLTASLISSGLELSQDLSSLYYIFILDAHLRSQSHGKRGESASIVPLSLKVHRFPHICFQDMKWNRNDPVCGPTEHYIPIFGLLTVDLQVILAKPRAEVSKKGEAYRKWLCHIQFNLSVILLFYWDLYFCTKRFYCHVLENSCTCTRHAAITKSLSTCKKTTKRTLAHAFFCHGLVTSPCVVNRDTRMDHLQPPLAQRAKKKLTPAFAQPPIGTASERKLAPAPFSTICSRP